MFFSMDLNFGCTVVEAKRRQQTRGDFHWRKSVAESADGARDLLRIHITASLKKLGLEKQAFRGSTVKYSQTNKSMQPSV
jgi:hypothetical protein